MDTESLYTEITEQLELRPYLTLAGVVALGWFLGRRVPLRALLALAGIGARTALSTAVERGVRSRLMRTR